MSRTFRRKHYSPVKEAGFIGWDIVKETRYGICSLSIKEQERIIKSDFNVFHSDAFRTPDNGYWHKVANKSYRSLFKQEFIQAYRKREEDEFIFSQTYKSVYYGLW